MLYTTNATVAALNHVPGFDPLKFLPMALQAA